jgi:hypothetical protein
MRATSRLPNADLAVIDEHKLTHYLLASDHPAGRAKAALFQRYGYGVADWRVLRDALLLHARTAQVVSIGDTEFGRKYVLEGILDARSGRRLRLRAVWFMNADEIAPRLVTAYPVPGVKR